MHWKESSIRLRQNCCLSEHDQFRCGGDIEETSQTVFSSEKRACNLGGFGGGNSFSPISNGC